MSSSSSSRVGVGFVLQPENAYLELLEPVFGELADYFELAPETTWWAAVDGTLTSNSFAERFAELGRRWAPTTSASKPFVAHGVALSLGGAAVEDRPRQRRWLDRLGEDQRRFNFRWLSDHLAMTCVGGESLALPLPLVPSPEVASLVRRRLRELQAITPAVAVENTAHYFTYGDPLDELQLLRGVLELPGSHLLLDLYNLSMMATNMGFSCDAYLDGLDLSRVIEIHLAGGSPSPSKWLPSGRSYLLDSHERSVPEVVWSLFERVLPRCVNLRGVTLERMEGTVGAADVRGIEAELRRLRAMIERCP